VNDTCRVGSYGRLMVEHVERRAIGWNADVASSLNAALGRLRRLLDYAMFVLLVGAVILASVFLTSETKVVALKLFVVAYFSLLPAILYLQFTSRRTPTVWKEYVNTLFRLHVDDYASLPEPPELSRYLVPWRAAHGRRLDALPEGRRDGVDERNIYVRRFEELYGPLPSRMENRNAVRLVRAQRLQVAFATLLIALGWVFVVQPETLAGVGLDVSPSHFPEIPEQSIAFGFLGAYFFVLQMLVRRFFGNDLKATAYVSATMRIIVAVLLVWVIDPVLPDTLTQAQRSAIAFVIGVFPTVGWQALQALVGVLLRRIVPSLSSEDPLSDLDGMNVWYEARLVEEGVEDIQNLATADLGTVLLRTRIPGERLVDWVDQALLRLQVGRASDLEELQRFGVRTATDLLGAVGDDDEQSGSHPRVEGMELILNVEGNAKNGQPSVMEAIALGLRRNRNVQQIRAWRSFVPSS
jgi:hypothetical protein